MGIAKGALNLLCETRRDVAEFEGSVLQLGRQHTFVTRRQIVATSTKFNLTKEPNAIPSQPPSKGMGFVDDVELFKCLGFSSVESLDYSSFEDATHVHDLNTPIPETMHGNYNVVLDGGTIEHIFDVKSVFKNIHDLLKVGGAVVHISPSSNHVDHGFYMFSPTLFFDYYKANGYEIKKSYIFEYSTSHQRKPWFIYDYQPGSIDHLSFGGWGGKKLLGIFFVAVKTPSATSNATPQQGMYIKRWSDSTLVERQKTLQNSGTLRSRVLFALTSTQFGKKVTEDLIRLRNSLLPGSGKPKPIARY